MTRSQSCHVCDTHAPCSWLTTCLCPPLHPVCAGQVLARGEKIELLVDKCDDLQHQAQTFQKQGKQLRSRMW